ncbi:hypothetical protein SBC1_13170 [Caballeronia sp. SBC1]|nr:hypothetical protein SBC2_14580 [Caballeronia sp. SBC2]QIN61327.1 hypothetical protein SBC1_13170 [Caballeronia sp. SBC1]
MRFEQRASPVCIAASSQTAFVQAPPDKMKKDQGESGKSEAGSKADQAGKVVKERDHRQGDDANKTRPLQNQLPAI